MANYYGTARTNYFKVKDDDKFSDLCLKLGVELIESEGCVGFMCNQDDSGSLPSGYFEEDSGDFIEIDVVQEVAKHLKKGEVAVFIESGAEKFRYVQGYAVAVNHEGKEIGINLNDIYKKAKEELGGKHISRAEY